MNIWTSLPNTNSAVELVRSTYNSGHTMSLSNSFLQIQGKVKLAKLFVIGTCQPRFGHQHSF